MPPDETEDLAHRDPGKTSGSLKRSVALDFEELSHGAAEVLIRFKGQEYRLRVTRNGKLILNK